MMRSVAGIGLHWRIEDGAVTKVRRFQKFQVIVLKATTARVHIFFEKLSEAFIWIIWCQVAMSG